MHVISHRLEKSYFVSERAAYDLRSDFDLKKRLDIRVEKDLIRRTEVRCDESKKKR